MEINITLAFQIIHFFIAWFMFKKLLLQPALEVILKDGADQRRSQQKVAQLRSDVAHYTNEKNAQWLGYQRYFDQKMPHIEKEKDFFLFRNLGEPLKPVVVDHSLVRKEQKFVEKKLVKKLGQVHE